MTIDPGSSLVTGTTVFADTAAYCALAVDEGDRHRAAAAVMDQLTRARARLYTSSLVLAETHALLLSRLNRIGQSAELFEAIYASRGTTIVRPTAADELGALTIIKRYTDKRFSFTDA